LGVAGVGLLEPTKTQPMWNLTIPKFYAGVVLDRPSVLL
jgi:hypothetical protein